MKSSAQDTVFYSGFPVMPALGRQNRTERQFLRGPRHRVPVGCRADMGPRHVPTTVRFSQEASRESAREAMQQMKARVAEYFASRGISSKADTAMVVKGCILLALAVVPYGLILSNRFGRLGHAGSRDRHGRGNRRDWLRHLATTRSTAHTPHTLASTICWACRSTPSAPAAISGRSPTTSSTTRYTNIHGVDEDLAVSPLLRLSPNAERLWFHRLQHFYAFPLYACTTLFWVFVKDYQTTAPA